ncbi:MAG: hypothetical protein ACJA0H_001387 [Francisellaceae bacterium]|jgi:hypothetical protein
MKSMSKILLSTFTLLSLSISFAGNNISKFSQDPWGNEVVERQEHKKNLTHIHKFPSYKVRNVKAGSDGVKKKPNENPLLGLFTDGTYTLAGLFSYEYAQPNNYYSYGATLFAQSGQIAGFSIGGNYTFINPWFENKINPYPESEQNIFLPSNRVLAVSQAFLQYDFSNTFQANAGWLFIRTPWLTSFNPAATAISTYQGVIANFQASTSLLITALATNRFQYLSQTSFSQNTMYSPGLNSGTGTPNIGSKSSDGAVSVGLQYSPDKNINVNLWGYIFFNYASMLYFDSGNIFKLNSDSEITVNIQAATQGDFASGSNALKDSGYGAPNSQLLGAEFIFSHKKFNLAIGYNALIGPNDSYEQGGLVSPYTYQIANDPLFTTSWIAGMVEKSAGNAVKVTPSIILLNNDLVIAPSMAYYDTVAVEKTIEWDLVVTYQVKQIKGLQLLGVYAMLQTLPRSSAAPSSLVQFMATYLF